MSEPEKNETTDDAEQQPLGSSSKSQTPEGEQEGDIDGEEGGILKNNRKKSKGKGVTYECPSVVSCVGNFWVLVVTEALPRRRDCPLSAWA
ncbi:hypothetical protein DMENIID0001_015260 [Sergentomyia squamirostris]